MASSNDDHNGPPPSNPILTAYESFVDKTPLVVRSVLTGQFLSYLASWLIDPYYALSNIPQFTFFRYELYRLVTSPLVNTSFFSLVFAYVGFVEVGRRLEHAVGSTAFAWLCFAIALATNVAFLLICIVMHFLTNTGTDSDNNGGGETYWLFVPAHGAWLVLFGIISLDCVQQHHRDPASRRYLFARLAVPTRYYPLVLYAVFALLNGGDASIGYLVSVAVGYGLGMTTTMTTTTAGSAGAGAGRTAATTTASVLQNLFWLSSTRIQHLEETVLSRWTTKPGFVTGTAASGITVSAPPPPAAGGGSSRAGGGIMGLPLFQPGTTASAGAEESDTVRLLDDSTGDAAGGRTLGGGVATRRAADARAARLQALEHNQQSKNPSGTDVDV